MFIVSKTAFGCDIFLQVEPSLAFPKCARIARRLILRSFCSKTRKIVGINLSNLLLVIVMTEKYSRQDRRSY
ncbi:MAG: hypothetical protein J6U11_04060, partial [Campylobacter sp.]|nr:hypothetical protein [Campylobacter sp.]